MTLLWAHENAKGLPLIMHSVRFLLHLWDAKAEWKSGNSDVYHVKDAWVVPTNASKMRLLKCGGHIDLPQFRVFVRRGSWTNFGELVNPLSR